MSDIYVFLPVFNLCFKSKYMFDSLLVFYQVFTGFRFIGTKKKVELGVRKQPKMHNFAYT